MKRHLLLIVAAGLLVAAEGRKEGAPSKERDKLQGYWNVVTAERDGNRVPAKDVKGLQFIFTGKKMTVNKGNKERYDATYKLGAGEKQKKIDFKFLMGPNEGKTFHGLYELDGNKLKICWSESGQERPKDLTAKSKSGHTLYVLKRSKP